MIDGFPIDVWACEICGHVLLTVPDTVVGDCPNCHERNWQKPVVSSEPLAESSDE
jgi:rubrerythrin